MSSGSSGVRTDTFRPVSASSFYTSNCTPSKRPRTDFHHHRESSTSPKRRVQRNGGKSPLKSPSKNRNRRNSPQHQRSPNRYNSWSAHHHGYEPRYRFNRPWASGRLDSTPTSRKPNDYTVRTSEALYDKTFMPKPHARKRIFASTFYNADSHMSSSSGSRSDASKSSSPNSLRSYARSSPNRAQANRSPFTRTPSLSSVITQLPPTSANSPAKQTSKSSSADRSEERDDQLKLYSPKLLLRKPVTLEQVRSDEDKENNIREELFSQKRLKPSTESQTQSTSGQLHEQYNSLNERASSASDATPTPAVQSQQLAPIRIKRDLKEPVPLINIGNTCYMNSVIQSLFSIPMLVSEIEAACKTLNEEQDASLAVTKSLLRLFYRYKQVRSSEQINENEMGERLAKFKQDIGRVDSIFQADYQQDAVEFLDCVINSIDDEFLRLLKQKAGLSNSFFNPISKVFKIGLGTEMQCTRCSNRSEVPEMQQHSLILSLPDEKTMESKCDWSLQHFLDNYFKEEKSESRCSNCQHNEKYRRVSVSKVPRVLTLQLVRHSKDEQKRQERIEIPQFIELPIPGNKLITEKEKQSPNELNPILNGRQYKEYQLVSVICHLGASLRSGHYNSFNYNLQNREWYKCDDNLITKTDFESVCSASRSSGYCFFFINKKFI